MTSPAGVSPVLVALGALAERVFAVTGRLARTVQDLAACGEPLTRARLRPVGELAVRALHENPSLLQGAGFVAAPGEVHDAPRWLEWFGTDPEGRPQRLAVQTDPSGESFYDYCVLPWFAVPRDTGARHVTGPYVDYVCTNDYTLTFTVPVTGPVTGPAGSRFLGVAGCDVGVGAAERVLMPSLRAASVRVAVVNRDGRILASNSGRHICGDLVDTPDVAASWEAGMPTVHRLGDLPLAVVELP